MKRLLVLLVATLGTGCVVSDTCDSHTLIVRWPSFVRVNSAGNGYFSSNACFDDFARMDVFVDGVGSSASCAESEIPFTVLTGDHTVTVEAVGTNGVLARDIQTVHVSDSCSDRVLDTEPGESIVSIDYAPPGGTCMPRSFMWFRVDDDITNTPIAELDERSDGSVQEDIPCSDVEGIGTVKLILPEGDFTLKRLEEVTFPTSTTFQVESGFCTATLFQTDSGVDAFVPPTSQPALELVDSLACRRP